jgi:nitrite reductase (NO-forming)
MKCCKNVRKGKLFMIALLLVFVVPWIPPAMAHGDEADEHEEEVETSPGKKVALPDAVSVIKYSAVVFGALLSITLLIGSSMPEWMKKPMFWLLVAPIIVSSLYLAADTVYLNISSVTKGPVHWHADTKVWICGEEMYLADPEGLANRVGTSVLHEHNDGRIHIEGVVKELDDVSLGRYFEAIGGSLDGESIMFPSTEGMVGKKNGDHCADGEGILAVYVNGKRIASPQSYVPAPETNVPPGDCIIFEFGADVKERTDKLCESWAANGWTYENMDEMRGVTIPAVHEEHDEEQHDSASSMYGHLTTFGPGEAAHVHAVDLSKFARVEDIAADPEDVPPPIQRMSPEVVKVSVHATEVISEIAPGITYQYWTFNNTVPGKMLRVREGDTVELTLSNDITSTHNHSIDLHAATGPGGGGASTQVEPGKSKTIRFKALNPGTYVYHCATPDVPMHVANGMYGLIVVEPKEGFPPVDKEFYVMQGELYTDGEIGEKGFQNFDPVKMLKEQPEYVVFNGRVKSLVDSPMRAKVGERVRLFVGNGGVAYTSSFHVIGEIFDKVYAEGSTSPPLENVQTTSVPAGGSAVVEFDTQYPANYVLVDHALARLDKGAWGILKVEGEENPEVYQALKE